MAKLDSNLVQGFDILVIEDDGLLAETIARGWPIPADRLKIVSSYRQSVQLIQSPELNYFDGVLLDVYLPDGDGLSILRTIRALADIPIVMMSGTGTSESRASAIEAGADGYMMKPFTIRELQAFIARLIKVRRGQKVINFRSVFEIGGGIVCNMESRLLSQEGKEVSLTDAEVRILNYLHDNLSRTCSRSALYKNAFFRTFEPTDKTLDVYISRIRGKFAEFGKLDAMRIQNVRGSGYRLSAG